MRLWIISAMLGLGAAPVAAEGPLAEIVCHPTHQLSERMERQYGESRFARGTQGPDQIMEVWTDEQGSWTLVVTYASGTSCIVAMGDNWDRLDPKNPA